MSAKLEKVLKLLINEQHDEAEALLHDWFVEEARNIHEELIAEDEYAFEDEEFDLDFDIEDANDEIDSEEFFEDEDSEDELDLDLGVELEDDELDLDADDAEEDLEADLELDIEDDLESSEDDLEDIDDGEEDLDDRLQDLESQFEELKAMFDELTDGDDFEEEDSDDGDDEEEDSDEDSDEDEDMFEDLEESFDLEKVNVDASAEGKTTEGSVSVNDKSATVSKGVNDRVGGKPVETKRDDHKGFAREEGASVEAAKPRKNVRKKATDDTSNVPEGGDKSALLNKGL